MASRVIHPFRSMLFPAIKLHLLGGFCSKPCLISRRQLAKMLGFSACRKSLRALWSREVFDEPMRMEELSTTNGDVESKLASDIWSDTGDMIDGDLINLRSIFNGDTIRYNGDIMVIKWWFAGDMINGDMMSIFYGLQWYTSLYHVIQCWYQYTMIYREQKSLKASERLREMFQFLHSWFLHNLYQSTMFRHFKSVPAIWLYLSATFFQWVPCAASSTIPCRRWYNSSVGWDLLNRLMKFLNISSDGECCRHVKHSLHIGFDIKSWHGKIRPDTSFRPTSLLGLRNARMTQCFESASDKTRRLAINILFGSFMQVAHFLPYEVEMHPDCMQILWVSI